MIKLHPGDYVSTDAMSESQYHAVCKAFMDAGAVDCSIYGYGDISTLVWDATDNTVWFSEIPVEDFRRDDPAARRKLTIQQVLEEPKMDIKEAYKVMQDNCGIEVGDTVKVLRAPLTSGENGWGTVLCPTLEQSIGQIMKVKDILQDTMVLSNGYCYPFFVLELVEKGKKLPEPIRISSQYQCEFEEDGSIAVGCQKLDFDMIEKIYLTAKEVKESV